MTTFDNKLILTAADAERLAEAVLASCRDQYTVIAMARQRGWRERLFSRPWRPWISKEMTTQRVKVTEQWWP